VNFHENNTLRLLAPPTTWHQ